MISVNLEENIKLNLKIYCFVRNKICSVFNDRDAEDSQIIPNQWYFHFPALQQVTKYLDGKFCSGYLFEESLLL